MKKMKNRFILTTLFSLLIITAPFCATTAALADSNSGCCITKRGCIDPDGKTSKWSWEPGVIGCTYDDLIERKVENCQSIVACNSDADLQKYTACRADCAKNFNGVTNNSARVACDNACVQGKTTPINPNQPPATINTKGGYVPMEEIPGFGAPSDFPTYLMAVYKFGLWAIGLAAMLMIMIGSFMYLTSAGNNSQMGTAKGMITDAIIGIVLALSSWVMLNTINPDLVAFKISAPSSTGTQSPGSNTGGGSTNIPKGCDGTTDEAIQKAAISNGLDPNYMKAIVKCGEGCNANKSPAGACGFGQVIDGPYNGHSNLTYNRCKICGIRNAQGECDPAFSCEAVQKDRDLDMNCSAKVIKDAQKKPGCGADLGTLARCYNGGNINAHSNETNNYVTKVSNCK